MEKKEEKELKQAFSRRWSALKSSWFKEGYKEEMWAKLLDCYNSGFKCGYCGAKMTIHGGSNSFSIEHIENNNRYNLSTDNLEIVCIGCNLLKRSISKDNFLKMISAVINVHGKGFYAEIKNESYEGIQKGLKKAKEKGKICNRPKKDVDINRVNKNIKRGLTIAEVALIENVSYSTITNRLREERERRKNSNKNH